MPVPRIGLFKGRGVGTSVSEVPCDPRMQVRSNVSLTEMNQSSPEELKGHNKLIPTSVTDHER